MDKNNQQQQGSGAQHPFPQIQQPGIGGQHPFQTQSSLSGAGDQHLPHLSSNPVQGSQWGGEMQQHPSFPPQILQQPTQGVFQFQRAVPGAQVQQPPHQNPGFQPQQPTAFGFQQGMVPMQPYPQQTQSAFQTPTPQIQHQGMGLPFGQAYPSFFQQPGMGGYPMLQMPSMMGGMYGVPPQMWMQPPAAPAQPASMDADDYHGTYALILFSFLFISLFSFPS